MNGRTAAGVGAAIAFLLAGCASPTPGGAPGAAASPASSTGAGHAEVATQDAEALFGALPTPPGADRLSSAPTAAPVLGGPTAPESPADPDLVQRTAWWSTSQSPTALMAWVAAHPPAGTTPDGSARAILGGQTSLWTRDFTAPAQPGVISERLVEASVSALPGGGAAMREDVIVTYLPAKPAGETLPVATTVTVAPVLPAGQDAASSSPGSAPITVTSPMAIAEITSLVNGLPVVSAARVNCPMDTGAGLRLTFRSASGAQLATAAIGASGCRTVSVVVGGDKQPDLSGGDGLSGQIMAIAGAHWVLTN